ncbi:MAG: helix-turn-helix domain-containing protein [Pirellulales bacterium]|nr:helix-turn-helix domain-containing protein [Pirellulales bacterium]
MALTVAELCAERGLNAEQLAERCGFEQTRANAIVLGRWTPKPEERRAIAELFEVSTDDIRWGHATPIQHLWGHGPT